MCCPWKEARTKGFESGEVETVQCWSAGGLDGLRSTFQSEREVGKERGVRKALGRAGAGSREELRAPEL